MARVPFTEAPRYVAFAKQRRRTLLVGPGGALCARLARARGETPANGGEPMPAMGVLSGGLGAARFRTRHQEAP